MFNFFKSKNDVSLYKKQLITLEKISSILLSDSSLEDFLNEICKQIPKVMDVSIVAILLWDEKSQQLRLTKISMPKIVEQFVETVTGKRINQIIYPTDNSNSPFTKAIAEKKLQYELDVTSLLYPLMTSAKANMLMGLVANHFRGAVVMPLIVKGEVLGILTLGWRSETLSAEDIGIITTFANQASIGVYNTRLYRENQTQLIEVAQRNNKLQAINIFTNKIISNLNPEELIQEALDEIPGLFGYLGAIYTEYVAKIGSLRIKAYSRNDISENGFKILGLNPGEVKFDVNSIKGADNINVKVIRSGKSAFSEKFHDLAIGIVPEFLSQQLQKSLKISSIAAVPIIFKGEIVGVVDFIFKDLSIDEVRKNEIETLLIITNQLSTALENASLYAQVDTALSQLKIYNEQLQEKYQFEKDMMGIMGHELRTPMTVARGMSELLISKTRDKNLIEINYFQDKLATIHTSIIKESDLIQTMLSTSHIDNNKVNLQLSKFSIIDLVDYAVMAFRVEAENKGLKFIYQKPSVKEIQINSDQSRIHEVVNNLISNAVKYTHDGSIEVKIEYTADFVIFEVSDTGVGIPKDQIENLGKKFFRIHGSNDDIKQKIYASGTGLGLYVVKGILEAAKGRLEIDSEIGKGSVFRAFIPIETKVTGNSRQKNEISHDLFQELGLNTKK